MTVREFLVEKATTPNEWLRRKPRTTHPEILELVKQARASGLSYNDDVERFVRDHVDGLPAYTRHGTEDRDPLISQLGAEVYLANGILRDEQNQAKADALLAEGFAPLDVGELVDGGRYTIKGGTLYSGHEVPEYGATVAVRAQVIDGRTWFMRKGAKTHGFAPATPTLVKEGW